MAQIDNDVADIRYAADVAAIEADYLPALIARLNTLPQTERDNVRALAAAITAGVTA